MMARSLSLAILATACTATRSFNGVGGSGPDDVWVVGGNYPAEGGTSTALAFHWDGASWTSRSDITGGGLAGVWSPTPDDVWFAGMTTLHYDGTSSTSQPAQVDGTHAVWGDGAGTVWAVGDGGSTFRFDASGMLTTPNTGATQPLFGVWGSGPSDVWAVGIEATMLHWQGTSWTASAVPVAPHTGLRAISGNASNDVWSVGDSGAIVHWDGSTWSLVSSGTTADLEGVWADGADDVWVVGGSNAGSHYGIVRHFDGTSWTQAYRGDSDFYAVWGTSPADVWAAGADLTVAHWNGTKWTSRQLSP